MVTIMQQTKADISAGMILQRKSSARQQQLGHDEYGEDKVTVLPVTTEEYGVSKAARPFNSRLDKSKLVENGFTPLPTWQDALGRYLKEIEF